MRWIANLVMLLGKKIQTECITESISEREVSNFDVDLGDKAEPFRVNPFNRIDFDLQDELAKESRKKGPKNQI
ncbi:hypothetical protein MHI48_23060 [Paenibacillus sp. FSL H7-0942]|uniref:hypothetical protein n=2 Tax=Paenibacillus TaxID=44249 RepID=UPI00096BFD86|nr:hypothetical protein BK129_21705 [Paenibacillus amylolyticus]